MRKKLIDIPIDWVTDEELERKFKVFVTGHTPHQIVTVNPEFMVISRHHEKFRTVLQEADLSIADGTGIVLGQSLFDYVPQRNIFSRLIAFLILGFEYLLVPNSLKYHKITGVDVAETLMRLSAEEGWRVFLLGAQPGVADKAATVWRSRYPALQIVGTSAGNPGDKDLIETIRATHPDILLVAYGAPKQDLFIAEHASMLKTPIMIGVGGTFDYTAGIIHRPPKLVRQLGMEWLARLLQQPKRFKRIYSSTIGYVGLLLTCDIHKD